MIAAAFDLSLAATGIAVTHASNGEEWLSCRTVATAKSPGHRDGRMDNRRVHQILGAVAKAVKCKPAVAAIEWLPQFEGKGDTSLRMAELHGVVRHWLWSQGIPIVDIRPVYVQMYATGKGGADKPTVKAAIQARYGTLPPAADGTPRGVHVGTYDEADALSMLAATLHWYGEPLASVPETHRRALDSIEPWPDLAGGAS